MKVRVRYWQIVGGSCALAWLLTSAIPGLQAAPIFEYSFPTSWNGTGTAVNDLSSAGNNGTATGTAVLSTNVPPGAPAGALSLAPRGGTPAGGGIVTNSFNLLENPTIAPAGGFVFKTAFLWDGGAGSHTVQKIIDNEGTESLQLGNINLTNGTADLQFRLNDAVGPTMQILANQWYDVLGIFDSQGNSIDGSGNLAGTAKLIVNGTTVSEPVVRLASGSGALDRPMAVGVLGITATSTIVNFSGYIYDPSVSLVPEPTSIAMIAIGIAAWFASAGRRR